MEFQDNVLENIGDELGHFGDMVKEQDIISGSQFQQSVLSKPSGFLPVKSYADGLSPN